MKRSNCYLSCTGRGQCFYDPNRLKPHLSNTSTTSSLDDEYCCYSKPVRDRYCCDDISLAVVATEAVDCSSTDWSVWRVTLLSFGVLFGILLLCAIFQSFKKCWRSRDCPRIRRQQSTHASRHSSGTTSVDSGVERRHSVVVPAHNVTSSTTADNAIETPFTIGQCMLPPSYDSLQPLPDPIDKDLPPTYHEAIDLSPLPAAENTAVPQPQHSLTSQNCAPRVDSPPNRESSTNVSIVPLTFYQLESIASTSNQDCSAQYW